MFRPNTIHPVPIGPTPHSSENRHHEVQENRHQTTPVWWIFSRVPQRFTRQVGSTSGSKCKRLSIILQNSLTNAKQFTQFWGGLCGHYLYLHNIMYNIRFTVILMQLILSELHYRDNTVQYIYIIELRWHVFTSPKLKHMWYIVNYNSRIPRTTCSPAIILHDVSYMVYLPRIRHRLFFFWLF